MPSKPRFRVERLDVIGSPAQGAQAGIDTQATTSPGQFVGPGAIVILVIECELDTVDLRWIEDNLAVWVYVADVKKPVGDTIYWAPELNIRGDPAPESPDRPVIVPDEVTEHPYAGHRLQGPAPDAQGLWQRSFGV